MAGATPLAEGSVWRSGQCVFTTRPPASRGRSSTSDPSGKGVQRHFEAAEYPPADRRPVGRAGIVRQGEVPMAPGSHLPKPRSTVHEGDPPTITANASIGKLWRVASTARPKPQLGRRQMSDCILAGWPVSLRASPTAHDRVRLRRAERTRHRRNRRPQSAPPDLVGGSAFRYGARMVFSQGLMDRERLGAEGIRDVHIPTLRDARTGHRNTRVAPGHGLEARFGIDESGGRGLTAKPPATCGVCRVSHPRADSVSDGPRWQKHTSGSASATPIRVLRTVSRALRRRDLAVRRSTHIASRGKGTARLCWA